MPDLPQPDIQVTEGVTDSGNRKMDLVISRDGKARSYSSDRATTTEAVKDLFNQVLADHHTAEYVKRG